MADSTGLMPNLYDPYAWMTDASIHGPGLYIDGFEILPGQEGLFWNLLASGAGVIAPIGANAYLSAGGTTYITLDTGRGMLPDGTIHLGVTLVKVGDEFSTWFLTQDMRVRPTLPQGTPQNQIEAFNRAFDEAERRLTNRRRCADLFGGLNNALNALYSTSYRFLPLGPPRIGQSGQLEVIGATTFPGPTVFINTQGPFLNQRFNVPGRGNVIFDLGTGLRGARFAALLLLHELGHVTGIFRPDANNSELNQRQTQRVIDRCF
jgi:hypothetical protein